MSKQEARLCIPPISAASSDIHNVYGIELAILSPAVSPAPLARHRRGSAGIYCKTATPHHPPPSHAPRGTHSPLRLQSVSIVYAPSANRMVRAICATAWDRRSGVAMCWGGSRTPIRNVTPQNKIEGHTENPIHGSLIRLEMTNPGTVRGPLNINGPHLQMGRSVDKR